MEESDSSCISSYSSSDSDKSTSTCLSKEDSEDLFLSLPAGTQNGTINICKLLILQKFSDIKKSGVFTIIIM